MAERLTVRPRIKVIGVGGGGCNFQEQMVKKIKDELPDSSFIAINTDQQSLQASGAYVKLQIGPNGLGAGANPQVGREAAEYSEEAIREVCKDVDLVVIFSGFGGGTGSGASPVVARIAREQGALVFGIVTKPFDFEGKVRKRIAEEAITEFRKNADVTVIVSNQLLFKITNQYTTFNEAFKIVDNMCALFVLSILEIFRVNGLINVDFADIDSTIRGKGIGSIGVGYGEGDDAANDAVMKALSNPLLENISMKSASNALVHIAGIHISLLEIEKIMKKIHEELGEDVNIIHGMTIGEPDTFNYNSFLYAQDPCQYQNSMAPRPEGTGEKWARVLIIVTGLDLQTPRRHDDFMDDMKIIEEVDIQNNSKTDFLNNNTTEKKNEGTGNIFSLLQKLSKGKV